MMFTNIIDILDLYNIITSRTDSLFAIILKQFLYRKNYRNFEFIMTISLYF